MAEQGADEDHLPEMRINNQDRFNPHNEASARSGDRRRVSSPAKMGKSTAKRLSGSENCYCNRAKQRRRYQFPHAIRSIVFFVIHPRLAAKYRQAFKSSGAKDDGNDSGFILDILIRHREKLALWKPEDYTTRILYILTQNQEDAIRERTRLSNQLKAIFKQFFPLALDVAGDCLATVIACEFLQRWISPESLEGTRALTIHSFYTQHGYRQRKVIESRLKAIKNG